MVELAILVARHNFLRGTKMDVFKELMIVEVLGLTSEGIRLYAQGEVLFLSFELFPMFMGAPVEAVFNVLPLGTEGVIWPELEIDLTIDSIRYPDHVTDYH